MTSPTVPFRFLSLAFVVLLALAGPIPADDSSVVAEVEARVAAFGTAFRDADVAALDTLLAPTYVHTNSGDAPIGREAWLRYVAARGAELASGELRLSRYENREVEIRLHGATAVVTGLNLSEGVRRGAPFSRRLRFTQVWVRSDGAWRRAAFHDAEASK